MPTINGGACVVNGKPVDKVFSNGKQVYGRNLLINSSSSATNGKTAMRRSSISIMGTYSRTDSYEQLIYDNNTLEFFYRFVSPDPNNLYDLIPGETYTLSGSVSHTSGKLCFRAEYWKNNTWNLLGVSPNELGNPISDGSVFTPFSYTFTVPIGATGAYFSLQIFNGTNSSLFRFKNMKLEKGSIATPWTPAPEDVGITA